MKKNEIWRKTRVNAMKIQRKLLKHSKIFKILFFVFYCLVWVIPVSLLFYSGFYDLQNPEAARILWEEGNESPLETKLEIQIVIRSISLENEVFDIIYYVQKQDSLNNTLIQNEKSEEFTLDLFSFDHLDLHFDNFSSSNLDSHCNGEVSYYPFDSYGFSFELSGINELNITNYNQIYVLCRCIDPKWEFSEFDAYKRLSDSDYLFKINFVIKRKIDDIIFKSILPLIILGGISYIGIIAANSLKDPSKETFRKNNVNLADDEILFNEKYQNYKDQINFDRKFRIDTSKWILAFSIANFYISTSIYSITSLLDYFSLVSIVVSLLFFATSKYQGKSSGAIINFILSIISIGLILSFFLPFLN